MKIRAAVLEEFAQPLTIAEVDLAEPRAGEVLVRLAACGVCHTDLVQLYLDGRLDIDPFISTAWRSTRSTRVLR